MFKPIDAALIIEQNTISHSSIDRFESSVEKSYQEGWIPITAPESTSHEDKVFTRQTFVRLKLPKQLS